MSIKALHHKGLVRQEGHVEGLIWRLAAKWPEQVAEKDETPDGYQPAGASSDGFSSIFGDEAV